MVVVCRLFPGLAAMLSVLNTTTGGVSRVVLRCSRHVEVLCCLRITCSVVYYEVLPTNLNLLAFLQFSSTGGIVSEISLLLNGAHRSYRSKFGSWVSSYMKSAAVELPTNPVHILICIGWGWRVANYCGTIIMTGFHSVMIGFHTLF